jgi:hypothetical protein
MTGKMPVFRLAVARQNVSVQIDLHSEEETPNVQRPTPKSDQSAIRGPQSAMGKGVTSMSREQIRKLTSLSSCAG